MASEAEIGEVARRLTKTQAAALITTHPDSPRGFDEISGKIRVTLFRKGLLRISSESRAPAFTFTPLGLRVKDYLANLEGR